MKQNRLRTKAGWPDSGEPLSFLPSQRPSLPMASQLPLGLRLSSTSGPVGWGGEVGLVEGTQSLSASWQVGRRFQQCLGGSSLGL